MEDVQKHIENMKLYDIHNEPYFDMRSYAKYLKEHNIPNNKVPKKVMEMFSK
jgi:hypothetical protein